MKPSISASSPTLVFKRVSKHLFSKASIIALVILFLLYQFFKLSDQKPLLASIKTPTSAPQIKIAPNTPTSLNRSDSVQPTNPAAPAAADKEGLIFVKKMFNHSWSNYVKTAWGSDYASPVSGSAGTNYQSFGIPFTIIDSLDTLFMMGFMEEFNYAKSFVENLNLEVYDKDVDISVFETTIRILGGFISAYDLSGDKIFMDHAILIGDKILTAYTKDPLPSWRAGGTNLAELGTNIVEMTRLSRITKDPKYENAGVAVFRHLNEKVAPHLNIPGLFPVDYSVSSGMPTSFSYSLGACSDSFYEYLLKIGILSKTTEGGKLGLKMWEDANAKIKEHLVKKNQEGLMFITKGMLESVDYNFEHLTCFVGGLYALNIISGQSKDIPGDMEIAEGVTKTCYEMYRRQLIGLSPDSVDMNSEKLEPSTDTYEQRPEALESIFYMHRLTKNPIYRKWAWEIMTSIEVSTREQFGYTGLLSIRPPMKKSDKQDSYFLAETLKYLFLIFEDENAYPLDKWVLNTEAHLMKVD